MSKHPRPDAVAAVRPTSLGGRQLGEAAVAPLRSRTRRPSADRARNVLRVRWGWIVLVLLVVVAGAAYLSWSRTPTYVSSADVLVQPRSVVKGTAPLEPDMGSEEALAASITVRDLAAARLHLVSAGRLSGLSVGVPLNTHVLHFSYTASIPDVARQNVQAFADAYVALWLDQQRQVTGSVKGGLVASVISPATRPAAPSSPNHGIDIGIAVVIGVILGFATAWIRDRFDDRLRGRADLNDLSDGGVLAAIPAEHLSRRESGARILTLRNPNTPAAAAYQDLRRAVLRRRRGRTSTTLLVTSPLGGAHSVVAANLAVSLARAQYRVVLVCADPLATVRRQSLTALASPGFADVCEGRVGVRDALHDTEVPDLDLSVMPLGEIHTDVASIFEGSELRDLLRELRASADFVIIDGPAALGTLVNDLGEAADMILLVATDGRTTRTQLRASLGRLRQFDDRFVGCVLDDSRPRAGRLIPLVTPGTDPATHLSDETDPVTSGSESASDATSIDTEQANHTEELSR